MDVVSRKAKLKLTPSKMGSFDEKLGVYTQQDVAEIIEY